jgi:tetratricopeptide (TPR) repeat protein
LFVRSLIKFQSGDYVGASADAERARRDAQAVGDMWAWSGARLIDASVARNFERYEASIAISDETFQAAIGNGELWMAARSLYTGAMALIHHGQPRKGLEYLEDAAELTSRLGDRWMLTEIEVREAEAWSLIGEHRRSADRLRVTLRKAEETHSSEAVLMATAALGQEELALGDADAAVRDLSSIVRPLWDAGILQLLSETMPALAAALSQIGRYEPAMVAATAQGRLQDRMGVPARDIEGLNARIGEAGRALGERSDRLRRRLARMPLEYLIDQLTWDGLGEGPSGRRSLVVDT